MAVALTVPAPVPSIGYQGITKIDFHFPHYLNAGEGNAMKISKSNILVVFEITTWAGNGLVVKTERKQVSFADWPVSFITDVRAVYNRLEQYSVAQGFIGAGTGEDI